MLKKMTVLPTYFNLCEAANSECQKNVKLRRIQNVWEERSGANIYAVVGTVL